MAVVYANLKKFFDDHPEHSASRDRVLKQAHSMISMGVITAPNARVALGVLADQFFRDLESDPKHTRLWVENVPPDVRADSHYWTCPHCGHEHNQDMKCAKCGFEIAMWSHGSTT